MAARDVCGKVFGCLFAFRLVFDKPFALGIRKTEKQLFTLFLERVGDVLEENEAEADMLVLRGVYVTAHLVGCSPESGSEVEARAGIGV